MSVFTQLKSVSIQAIAGKYLERSGKVVLSIESQKLQTHCRLRHIQAHSLALSERHRQHIAVKQNHNQFLTIAFHPGKACRPTSPLHIPKRTFSVDTYNKYFSADVAPIGFAQKVLEGIHSTTGLPWWASIALSTIAIRGVITLPLAVYSMHIMAKVELLQPEIASLSQELRREVAVAVKKFAWDAKYARYKYNSTMQKLVKDLYIRENCHPAKSSLVLWFQIPIWVCLSFALRNMSGAVPTASKDTEAVILCPDLKTEGTLWFPDLTMPDTTLIFPVLLGITNLLNIEMHTLLAQRISRFQKSMTFVMRLLSVIMVPIGAVVPSCMCYYWLCSSLFGLGQNFLFKIPSVRRLLRLPKTPSESQTPFVDLYNAAKQKYVLRPIKKEL